VEAAKAFYGDLLAVGPEAERPGGAIFVAGSAKLLLHERGDARRELRERRFVLLVEPRDYPWARSAYLRDPDGRLVELNQADR